MDTIVCKTPDQIKMRRYIAIKNGLVIELKGLRHSPSAVFDAAKSPSAVFDAAKKETGKKTRVACHAAICEIIEKLKNS